MNKKSPAAKERTLLVSCPHCRRETSFQTAIPPDWPGAHFRECARCHKPIGVNNTTGQVFPAPDARVEWRPMEIDHKNIHW
jgi:hypothetical protein